MRIGYARISTDKQSLARQIDQLKEAGCERIFEETMSGTKERPILESIINSLEKNDQIIITELSRISRSVKQLFQIVEKIEGKGANIKSLKESWIDTTTPQGKFLFTVFSGISQFEVDLLRQRTKDGLASARARGRFGGRPKKSKVDIRKAIELYKTEKFPVKDIEKMTGVSKSTLYKYIKMGIK